MLIRFLFISVLICSCSEEPKVKEKEIEWTTEKSTQMNKDFAIEEDLRIKMYVADRPSWKTIKTGSGLRYYIYEKGAGEKASSGLTAEVKYTIQLLDGTLCYQTKENETDFFKIDKSDIESGVQEGIKKMKIGDKAKLLVPSHLAHGLIGDLEKIPPLQALVIDIELISLK